MNNISKSRQASIMFFCNRATDIFKLTTRNMFFEKIQLKRANYSNGHLFRIWLAENSTRWIYLGISGFSNNDSCFRKSVRIVPATITATMNNNRRFNNNATLYYYYAIMLFLFWPSKWYFILTWITTMTDSHYKLIFLLGDDQENRL